MSRTLENQPYSTRVRSSIHLPLRSRRTGDLVTILIYRSLC